MGAVIAFLVGALLWPVHAREVLRQKIANILAASASLYRAVAAAALQGVDDEQQVRDLDRRLHDLRRGITQQMDEARTELAFSRFNPGPYQRIVELADQIRRRLTAMAEDRSLYLHAQVSPGLVPSMTALVQKSTEYFVTLAQALLRPETQVNTAELDAALKNMEAELASLREKRATAPFALDRMLPFWALTFNLRELAVELKELGSTLPQLA
jgi:hypothetical protein